MNTLHASYPEMLVEGITSFDNLVIIGKMIENALKNGRIEAEETKEGIMLKNEEEAQQFSSRVSQIEDTPRTQATHHAILKSTIQSQLLTSTNFQGQHIPQPK